MIQQARTFFRCKRVWQTTVFYKENNVLYMFLFYMLVCLVIQRIFVATLNPPVDSFLTLLPLDILNDFSKKTFCWVHCLYYHRYSWTWLWRMFFFVLLRARGRRFSLQLALSRNNGKYEQHGVGLTSICWQLKILVQERQIADIVYQSILSVSIHSFVADGVVSCRSWHHVKSIQPAVNLGSIIQSACPLLLFRNGWIRVVYSWRLVWNGCYVRFLCHKTPSL